MTRHCIVSLIVLSLSLLYSVFDSVCCSRFLYAHFSLFFPPTPTSISRSLPLAEPGLTIGLFLLHRKTDG